MQIQCTVYGKRKYPLITRELNYGSDDPKVFMQQAYEYILKEIANNGVEDIVRSIQLHITLGEN